MSTWRSPTKIRKSIIRNCKRKVPHETMQDAAAAMEEVRAAGKLYNADAAAYKCLQCGKYHFGRPMSADKIRLLEGASKTAPTSPSSLP